MSYNINIIEKNNNPLTKRTEITFSIEGAQKGTPNRYEIKTKIAALETADENLVFIKKLNTSYGSTGVTGRADIYEDEESASSFEPTYMKIRNLPKEQRDEQWKKIREAKRKKKQKGL